MSRIIQELFQMPLFSGLAAFAILLVLGLYVSDWNEKRRERHLARLRQKLREGAFGSGPAAAAPKKRSSRARVLLLLLAITGGVAIGSLRQIQTHARSVRAPESLREIDMTDVPPGFVPIIHQPLSFGLASDAVEKNRFDLALRGELQVFEINRLEIEDGGRHHSLLELRTAIADDLVPRMSRPIVAPKGTPSRR